MRSKGEEQAPDKNFLIKGESVRASTIVKMAGGLAVGAAALALAACGSAHGTSPLEPPQASNLERAQGLLGFEAGTNQIQHVVIIIQENRSFDNLFQGFPGADTQSYGYDSSGKKITLAPADLGTHWDVDHDAQAFFAACNGKGSYPGTDCQMNGFNKEGVQCGSGSFPRCPDKYPQYAYAPHDETKPYFEMAAQYVLADRMFSSNFDGSSFIAHQYLIAAQAGTAVNYPAPLWQWGCYGKQALIPTLTLWRAIDYSKRIAPCFNNKTLGDELDEAHISWRFYTSSVHSNGGGNLWSPYAAIKQIFYGPDWKKDVINPQTTFFSDVEAGDLPTVSWITPICPNSDHAPCATNHGGPSWVTSLVNAVGESKYWNSTAIFVLWDDYGGWYDHVPPKKLDYDGLGFRVPLIVISAYAKKGRVSHVPYEFGSILRFVEHRFGLATLSFSDARATDPAGDCFDFNQPPRKFQKIPSPLGKEYFLHQLPDPRPPDDE
jgi:phospholipase C